MILLASAALVACGDGRSDQSDANDQMETAEPSVAPETDMDDEGMMSTDTTTTSGAGTTDAGSGIDTTSTQGTPVR